jgi:hypothetical protein
MEHARTLLHDALQVLTAAAAVTNPPLKDVLAKAALSATELAAAELRRVFQPNPAPTELTFNPMLDLTPIEPPSEEEDGSASPTDLFEPPPTPNHSRPYLKFVAAMVPVLRAANPTDTQQTHITRIGELWQRHKGVSAASVEEAMVDAITAATAEVMASTRA